MRKSEEMFRSVALLVGAILIMPWFAAHAETIPNFIQGGGDISQQAQTTGKKLLDLLGIIAAMVLIGTFIWGGVQFAGDDTDGGKRKMVRSATGLAIVGGVYVFSYFFLTLFRR